MVNVAIFTNEKYIANNRPFATWYDGTQFCNGRGQRLDGAFIDTSLSKEVIKDVIIPSCYFSKDNIFILNGEREQFVRTGIDDLLKLVKKE